MSELKRLRESDPEWRQLLQYTKAQATPAPDRVEALVARVAARLSAPGDAGATAKAGHPLLSWLFGAVVLAGLGVGTLWPRRVPMGAQEPSAVTAPTPAPAIRETVTQAKGLEPASIEETTAPPEPRVQQRPARRTRQSARPPAQVKRSDPTAELALLKGARGALLSDPQVSLQLVDQHRREHPAGLFAEEREALAVEALWRAGDHASAARRLRALLAHYPRSTYRERLSTLVAGER